MDLTTWIVSEILAVSFVSLFIYLIIFKTWQRFQEGLNEEQSKNGVMTRSLVSGFNAGILGELILGPEKQKLLYLGIFCNVIFWLLVAFLYGKFYINKITKN